MTALSAATCSMLTRRKQSKSSGIGSDGGSCVARCGLKAISSLSELRSNASPQWAYRLQSSGGSRGSSFMEALNKESWVREFKRLKQTTRRRIPVRENPSQRAGATIDDDRGRAPQGWQSRPPIGYLSCSFAQLNEHISGWMLKCDSHSGQA
jgi:hypothetical protein